MLTRRGFLGGFVALAAVPVGAQAAADHPSVTYMKQVGKDLLNAHRQGTVSAFMRAVQRHGDIQAISDYSLGNYGAKLAAGQRQHYYRGVATFISRYFAQQSREYRIAKYEIGEASASDSKNVTVSSTVFLLSGQTYTVNWKLTWKNGRYRITDAKMLGFSLTYMQRNLFTDFLDKRNGDVAQLVAALNRGT
jgi:phospholipid transport system substrate-binding protein